MAHSYAGLYAWAVYHRRGGWQAELASRDRRLPGSRRNRSVRRLPRRLARPAADMALGDRANRPGGRAAGNIGHIQAEPGQPVLLADRLTAATSPLAAFAGLSAGCSC